MDPRPIVVPSGHGARVGNVEFLARTADTARFNVGIVELAPGRELDAHAHADEDDAFYILDGELTFVFGPERVTAPAGTFVLVPPGVEHGFAQRAGGSRADAEHPRAGRGSTGASGSRLTLGGAGRSQPQQLSSPNATSRDRTPATGAAVMSSTPVSW